MMNLAKVMAILAFTGAVTANPVPEGKSNVFLATRIAQLASQMRT